MSSKYDCVLHIVGKLGWLMHEFQQHYNKLKKSYPENIFWHENCSDSDLNSLYESSDCLIQASYAEGYGLPIVEAISKAKLIICRDIPVFHEVGQDYPFYFNNEVSGSSLLDVCKGICDKDYSPRDIEKARSNLITWGESCQILSKQLFNTLNNSTSQLTPSVCTHSRQDIPSTVFIFVGHTASFSKITGIQDVVRQLISGLTTSNIQVVLLGWDQKISDLKVLSAAEIDLLVSNTRHPFLTDNIINLSESSTSLNDERVKCSTLLMPELPYHSSSQIDISTTIAKSFSKYFSKVVCIYYDAIPCHYPAYNDLGSKHYDYLCSLKYYDKILSISDFSRLNLIETYNSYDLNINVSALETVPLGLSSDFSSCRPSQIKDNAVNFPAIS